MSTSYIRFFSPTQLLPDGLLILFMFALIYFSIKMGILMLYNVSKGSYQNKIKSFQFSHEEIDKPEHYNIKAFCTQDKNPFIPWISILSLIVFIPYSIDYLFISNYKDFTFSVLIISIPVLIIFIFIFYLNIRSIIYSGIFKLIIKWIKSFPKVVQDTLHFLFNLMLGIVLFSLIIFILLKILSIFHQVYLFPDNLVNMKYIQKNEDTNNTKISYMNDKYIFLEHKQKDKNISIEILKFDELFKK